MNIERCSQRHAVQSPNKRRNRTIKMKNLTMTLAAIALATASFTTLAATQVQSIGVISAQAGTNLSSLENKLAAKAQENGASSYRIISASGDNRLYGTAELYK